jgi:hypothetical protein
MELTLHCILVKVLSLARRCAVLTPIAWHSNTALTMAATLVIISQEIANCKVPVNMPHAMGPVSIWMCMSKWHRVLVQTPMLEP